MDYFESLLELDLDSLVDGLGLNVVDGLGLNVGTNVVSDPVNILPFRGNFLDDFDSLLELELEIEEATTDDGVAANAIKAAIVTVVATEIFIIGGERREETRDGDEEPVSKFMSIRCALPRLEKMEEYHFVFPQQL